MKKIFITSLWANFLTVIICSKYNNNTEIGSKLQYFADSYPDLAEYSSIGKSVQGRELHMIKIGATPSFTLGVPNIKLIGNIHGNEPIGAELLLLLIEDLLDGYENNPDIETLLESVNIYILPSLNPDGFAKSVEGMCSMGPGRSNANNVDLNRNFPSAAWPTDVGHPEPETAAVMEWMMKTQFMLSLALHGGAVVANYPYDVSRNQTVYELQKQLKDPVFLITMLQQQKDLEMEHLAEESLTDDDPEFKHLARSYAKNHAWMSSGKECPNEPAAFKNGTVNGAAWYPIVGSMQDYNYDYHGCLELTIELSCCKYPNPKVLPSLWEDNHKSLISFLWESQRGVKGIVRHRTIPIEKATIIVSGRENIEHATTKNGEYWRYLLPGKYYLKVEKYGFKQIIRKIEIKDSDRPLIVNFEMELAIQEEKEEETSEEETNTNNFPGSEEDINTIIVPQSVDPKYFGTDAIGEKNEPTENSKEIDEVLEVLEAAMGESSAVIVNSPFTIIFISIPVISFHCLF